MKKSLSVLCAMALSLCLTSCSDVIKAKDNTSVIKYSTVFGATGTQADGAKALGDLIYKNSDGRLKMEFYPSSQLGDKIATFEGLRGGFIEMTECAATDLSGFESMWSVFALPYLWDNGLQAVKTVMDPEVSSFLNQKALEYGFIIIAWTNMGSRSVINSKKTVKTPEDLKGLKLRCMEDKLLADSVNAMGAIATPLAFNEVYSGMQQGTIDGTDHTPASVASSGWQEICKYYSLTEHFTIPDPVFISKKWFDTISPENQQAILKAGEEFTYKWNYEIWPAADDKGLEVLKKAGVEITNVDKELFRQAVQPVIDNFFKSGTQEQKDLYDLLIRVRERY